MQNFLRKFSTAPTNRPADADDDAPAILPKKVVTLEESQRVAMVGTRAMFATKSD
jgi:hypothetical protein